MIDFRRKKFLRMLEGVAFPRKNLPDASSYFPSLNNKHQQPLLEKYIRCLKPRTLYSVHSHASGYRDCSTLCQRCSYTSWEKRLV
ncbi:hypothetical protein BS78_09G258400 [Paspalum vaginatum]|nr:hypothetical protein BS78_09G258400 [Paspalum vaginatum]KAJ1264375.1 hypothetical protein BS78_09G258400 [Paspalum vaginatum]